MTSPSKAYAVHYRCLNCGYIAYVGFTKGEPAPGNLRGQACKRCGVAENNSAPVLVKATEND